MKFINIGFGNMVSATRLVAIVSPESAPIRRIITKAKESNMLVDAPYGRRRRSVLISDSDHVILSPIQPETSPTGSAPIWRRKRRKRMNKRGTLFVVTGPSGAGKGTVLKKVMAATDHLYFSISATTRAPRPGEIHGVHYHFITRECFAQLIREERLLEHAEYVGNFYGTPLDPVLEHLAQGDDVILEIEIQGAKQVKARYPEAALVFIAPPSFDELERRLRGRGTETEETILRRMDTARRECAHMDAFQYIVLNDTPENGAYELLSIITAHRCRRENRGFELK